MLVDGGLVILARDPDSTVWRMPSSGGEPVRLTRPEDGRFADIAPAESIGSDGRVSLRDESRAGRGSFFVGYGSSRGHRGGGLHGGK